MGDAVRSCIRSLAALVYWKDYSFNENSRGRNRKHIERGNACLIDGRNMFPNIAASRSADRERDCCRHPPGFPPLLLGSTFVQRPFGMTKA